MRAERGRVGAGSVLVVCPVHFCPAPARVPDLMDRSGVLRVPETAVGPDRTGRRRAPGRSRLDRGRLHRHRPAVHAGRGGHRDRGQAGGLAARPTR